MLQIGLLLRGWRVVYDSMINVSLNLNLKYEYLLNRSISKAIHHVLIGSRSSVLHLLTLSERII